MAEAFNLRFVSLTGGCAEYTCVPVTQVQAIKAKLLWETLGALPEMLQTARASLFKSLRLEKRERLLIRGGTTSIGLAAAAIAKTQGASVVSTSRNPERAALLRKSGADQVFIDTGSIAERSRKCVQEVSTRCLSWWAP